MQPAAAVMAEAFQSVALEDAQMPVISNVDAQPHRKAVEIRRLLVRQVSEPVMWTQCVMTLLEAGCTHFMECGPGKVLTGSDETHRPLYRLHATSGSAGSERQHCGVCIMSDTEKKVALVTGASRGIGAAIAQALGELSLTVIGTATSESGSREYQRITERLRWSR